jgi:Domain of unknown function (DUF6531)
LAIKIDDQKEIMMKMTSRALMFVVLSATTLLLVPLMTVAQTTACDIQTQYFFPDPPIAGAYRCDHVDTNLSLCYVKNDRCTPTKAHLETRNRCPSCGSPIDVTSGNTYIDQTDFAIPGLGGGLSLTRTWNSKWPFSQQQYEVGRFGMNWRSSYEERIYMGSDNYTSIHAAMEASGLSVPVSVD